MLLTSWFNISFGKINVQIICGMISDKYFLGKIRFLSLISGPEGNQCRNDITSNLAHNFRLVTVAGKNEKWYSF